MDIIIAPWTFSNATSFADGARQFILARSPALNIGAMDLWDKLSVWLQQPQVYSTLIAWIVVLCFVYISLSCFLGFAPHGVVAGSFAAAFQAWAYGGFTPAGGLFATITSIVMLGYAMPLYLVIAAVVATIVATIVWVANSG